MLGLCAFRDAGWTFNFAVRREQAALGFLKSRCQMLGITLGSVQPMIMSTLHHLTPDDRHGEALAFRSMAINASSTLMPLAFGAAGTLAGAGLLFWVVGGAVGAGSWLARRFAPAG